MVHEARMQIRPWNLSDWKDGTEAPWCESVNDKFQDCSRFATHIFIVKVDDKTETGEFLCTRHAEKVAKNLVGMS